MFALGRCRTLLFAPRGSCRALGQIPTLSFSSAASPEEAEEEHENEADVRIFKDLVMRRHHARKFTDKPIPEGVLEDILALAQRAPTSFNSQPYACVVVREQGLREKLSTAMIGRNANRVYEAPASVVFLADLEMSKRVDRIVQLERENGAPQAMLSALPFGITYTAVEGLVSNTVKSAASSLLSPLRPMPTVNSPEAWAFKHTMMAAQTLILAATAHGLDTAPMEGFDQGRVRPILEIPSRYAVPVIISLGYGVERTRYSPRLPPNEVFFDGKFGQPYPGIKALTY